MHRSFRQIILEAIPFLILLGFALYYLGFLLREDIVVFGGSPGQYFRFWYPLESSFPSTGSIFDWNPYWYAGYPEMQFYPPGFVLLGLLIKLISFGSISTVLNYQLINFIAYLLPGLTIYIFFRCSGFGRLAGLAAGFFALVFPDLLGGAGAIFDGMLGDRLSLGVFPLVLFAGIKAIEGNRKLLWLIVTSLSLAAIVLLHSFQAVAPVLALTIFSLFSHLKAGIARNPIKFLSGIVASPALSSVLAIVLSSFWLLPLLASSKYATPVLRTPFEHLDWWLFSGRLPFFAVLACIGLVSAFSYRPQQKRIILMLAITPLLVLVFMVFDYLILIDRFKFYSLDPIRFVETIYFCVLMLAGVGFANLARIPRILSGERFDDQLRRTGASVAMGAGPQFAAIGGLAVLLYLAWQPFPGWIDGFRPERPGEPRLVSKAVERYRLDKLWSTLKEEPAGRVLFTSSQFRLRRSGAEVLPTYLMALTPLTTGREIIGGTFHHWSPLATFYWYGFQKPEVMRDRTDLMDDQSLFGMKWSSMNGDALYDIIRRLNITTVVASDYDVWARTFLDRSPRFKAILNDPEYVVYRVLDYTPSLIESDSSLFIGSVTEYTGRSMKIHVQQSEKDANLTVKIAEYPLWHARANGNDLTIEKDDIGLMKLKLPQGYDYDIVLTFERGSIENIGFVLSIIGLLFSSALFVYALFRKA